MRTPLTVERVLAAAFGGAAVVLLFVGATGYSSVSGLIEADQKVSTTHQVRRELNELQARLTDAETGQRGYVITGDERFLAPYLAGLEQIGQLTARLRVLMAGSPERLSALDRIDVNIEAKLAELKQTVEMRREAGFDPAAKVVSGGTGKKIMDEIRIMIADMDREEQAQLVTRVAAAEYMAWRAKIVVLGGSAIGLLAVVAGGYYTASALGRQIGSTAQKAHTASVELRTAAEGFSDRVRALAAAAQGVATSEGWQTEGADHVTAVVRSLTELEAEAARASRTATELAGHFDALLRMVRPRYAAGEGTGDPGAGA
jgi:methyl-accepting chemotaxis protein